MNFSLSNYLYNLSKKLNYFTIYLKITILFNYAIVKKRGFISLFLSPCKEKEILLYEFFMFKDVNCTFFFR